MKKLLAILFINFFVSCASLYEQKKSVDLSVPDFKVGCSNVDGKDRAKCISKLLDELEDIKNSNVKATKIKSERIDEDYVRVVYKYCLVSEDGLGRELYCFEETSEEYQPSPWGTVKRNLFVSGIGFSIGVIFFGIVGM